LVGGATLTAFAEVLGVFQSGAVPGDPDVGRVAWGLEWRLAADLWIETGVGSTFGTASAPEHLFTLATLKWALADRPKFSLPAR